MGLISAATGAIGSTLRDQWKEFFYCDALPANTIAVKAQKKTKGFLNRNDDNIISDGSLIAVADGQCMIIVEQGQVVEICAEPGEYRYDNTIAPSLFAGELSKFIEVCSMHLVDILVFYLSFPDLHQTLDDGILAAFLFLIKTNRTHYALIAHVNQQHCCDN